MEKIFAIKLSQAALIRENAFRDVLGYNNQDIKDISGNDELERHCGDKDTLSNVRDYIRTDGSRGLPSLSPSRTILPEVINSVGLGSTISSLDTVISDNAFYEK
jgi:hypothetical protein